MHIDVELPLETVAIDAAWIRACARRLTLLDSLLDPADAETVAAQMCQLQRWRTMRPGVAAASMMFEVGDRAGRCARAGRR